LTISCLRFKVENADNSGRYPFFTSGEAILSDSNYLVDYENVFLATGGVANIKYYKGKANYSADTYCLQAKITTKYLYYFLLKNLTKIDYKYFLGSGLKHLQKNDFKKEILILPSSYYEQQKIAEILETVDETIDKTDAIIEKYKRVKQGLMQDLLTKGIDENGQIRTEKTHKFKNSPLGRIPEEWEVMELGKTVDIYDNLRIPLNNEDRKEMKGKYPYCGANGVIDYINKYIFDGEYVLVAEDGGYFKRLENSAYLMKGKFWVNNHAHIISAKNNIALNKYILYNLIFWDLSIYINGTTREKLNQNKLRLIKIFLPPLSEQKRIASVLSEIDETIEKEQKYKEKLEKIKQGLMEDLLTGKVRVNHLIKEGAESV